jgi:serine protease
VPSGQIGSVSRAMSDMQATFGVTMLPMRTLETGGLVMQLAQPMLPAGLQNLIAMLAQNSAVEYAHEDVLLKAAQDRCEVNCTMYLPDDPLYGQQFHLVADNTTSRVGRLPFVVGRFSSVWGEKEWRRRAGGSRGLGITPHPDLAANLLPGYDFISDPSIAIDGDGRDASPLDPGDFAPAGACGPGLPATNSTWHGTHVSGLIAAVSGNSLGVVGVARNAKVLPVRALGRCGGFLSDIAEAVIWAAGGDDTGRGFVRI